MWPRLPFNSPQPPITCSYAQALSKKAAIYDNSNRLRNMEQVERSIFRRVMRLPSVAAWGIVLMIAIPGQASGQAFPVWVSSNLVRVGQADAPGTTSSIDLYSGRGETVASQVVVQAPAGGLTNVNLSVSALTGPNGVTIPASSMSLLQVPRIMEVAAIRRLAREPTR